MAGEVLTFPGITAAIRPLACFVRIGEAHKKLSDLHASGRLPAKRVVVDASRFRYQHELTNELRESGAEVVLDTEVAELAAPSKFAGHSRHAPWASASEGDLLGPQHFQRNASADVIGQIARFAVKHQVDVVLAPTHYLGDLNFANWLEVDREACLLLRSALDREGGAHIAIDYPVIIPHTDLNSSEVRGELTASLVDLPIDSVWIRASGLGPDVGPLTMKRYLAAMSGLHNMGKPIIADHLGGFTGMTAMAFGAASGIAVGIGERERFDARGWHKPPPPRKEDDSFGRAVRVALPSLNRSATIKELELLTSATNGKKLLACGDRRCCPHGLKDMIDDPRRHAAYQLFARIEALQKVPDLKRGHYFLNGPIADADRLARQVKQLKPSEEVAVLHDIDVNKLMKRLYDHSRRIEKLRSTLENIHEARTDEAPRAHPLVRHQPAIRKSKEDKR